MSDTSRAAEYVLPEHILPENCKMSDVIHVAEYAPPEYILPDDPPDTKPDLNILKGFKDESTQSKSSSSTSPGDLQSDAIKEEPTAGPSGSAAAPGLERVKLDVSEAEVEEESRRDDELGLVGTALGRTLRPVLRRCDEVLSRPDGVQVSAITAGQRRRLGRLGGKDITPRVEIVTDFIKLEVEEHELHVEIVTDFIKLEVEEHELEDDPAWTISKIRGSHTSTDSDHDRPDKTSSHDQRSRGHGSAGRKRRNTGGNPAEKRIKNGDPENTTPGLSMSVEVKEEIVGETTSSSSSDGGVMIRCAHCDFACLEQNHLDKHVKQRHGHIERDGKHKCEWCEHSTDRAYALRDHRVTHTGERRHRCDDCEKTFARLSSLTVHRRVHSGQRPYGCDVCGKAFNDSGNLTTHKRIHSGMKVRQCDQCGATFTRASNYTTHMMSHNGVKAHRCQVCSARFVTLRHLTLHTRTHTGERPYSCSFCAARFSHQSHMKQHVTALHTHDYRHRCGRCGKGFIGPSKLKKHVDKCSVGN